MGDLDCVSLILTAVHSPKQFWTLVQIDGAVSRSRSETVAKSFPEESAAWERVNREREQLEDRDKTPCARDQLYPHMDQGCGYSGYYNLTM